MEYFLLAIIFIIAIFPTILEAINNKFDFFNIKNLFLTYFIVEFVFSGFVTFITHQPDLFSLDLDVDREYYFKALYAILLGICSFHIGYYFTFKKSIQLPRILKQNWRTFNSNLLFVFMFITGFTGFFSFMLINGGISSFIDNVETFRAGGVSGVGIFLYLSTQWLIFSCLINFISNSKKVSIYIMLLYFISCLLPSVVFGFRSLIGLPILQFLVIWNYQYKRINVVKFVPIITLIVIIFIGYGLIRELPKGVELSMDEIATVVNEKPELAYSIVSRVKGVEVVAKVIKKMDQTGEYDLGYKGFWETMTIPIPRSIWTDKPTPTGVRFTTYFYGNDFIFFRGVADDEFGGASPTIIGEYYWYFGWAGVCVLMFILGTVFNLIYRTFINNISFDSIKFLYAIIFPIFVMFAEFFQGYMNSMILALFTFFMLNIILIVKK